MPFSSVPVGDNARYDSLCLIAGAHNNDEIEDQLGDAAAEAKVQIMLYYSLQSQVLCRYLSSTCGDQLMRLMVLLQDDSEALAGIFIEPDFTLDHLATLEMKTTCRYTLPQSFLLVLTVQDSMNILWAWSPHVCTLRTHAGTPQQRRLPSSQSQIPKSFWCPFLHETAICSLKPA